MTTGGTTSGEVRVIALLSGWGCGSTAVAGFLEQCGAFSCPPHFLTNDERTPVSYEPAALRAALVACFDEPTLAKLMGWTPPDGLYGKVEVLKHH